MACKRLRRMKEEEALTTEETYVAVPTIADGEDEQVVIIVSAEKADPLEGFEGFEQPAKE